MPGVHTHRSRTLTADDITRHYDIPITSPARTLLDLSRVEQQALARYTKDAGNHVSIEVRPAATLALP